MKLLGIGAVLCLIWIVLSLFKGSDSTGQAAKSCSDKEDDEPGSAAYRESEEEYLARQRFDEFEHRLHASHDDPDGG